MAWTTAGSGHAGRLDRRVKVAGSLLDRDRDLRGGHRGEPSERRATEPSTYPGRAPAGPAIGRSTADGLRLAVSEWGDVDAPPILFAHGGFDFAGTYDVFAPMVADAGWRVVAWDQRGHGDSAYAHLYSWEADVRDALAVIDSIGPEPAAGARPQQGRLADAAARRRAAAPGPGGDQSRRPAVDPELARRTGAQPDPHAARRHRVVARPSPPSRRLPSVGRARSTSSPSDGAG